MARRLLTSVQFTQSVVSDSLRPHGLQHARPPLPITNSWSLSKLMSIGSVMPSNRLILCHPLLLPPSIFPSIKVFSNESVLQNRWPKYWSFSFSIRPSSDLRSGPLLLLCFCEAVVKGRAVLHSVSRRNCGASLRDSPPWL